VAFFCGCEEHSILNTNAIPFPLLLLLLSTLLLTGAPETEALSGFNLSEAKDVTRAAAMPEISPKPAAAATALYNQFPEPSFHENQCCAPKNSGKIKPTSKHPSNQITSVLNSSLGTPTTQRKINKHCVLRC
jgi:hypothetical protein